MLFLFWSFFFDEDPQAELLSITPSEVKYPEVWNFLSELKLERYYEKLVEEAYYTTEELLMLQESRLEKLRIPMAHRDKILEAVEELKKRVKLLTCLKYTLSSQIWFQDLSKVEKCRFSKVGATDARVRLEEKFDLERKLERCKQICYENSWA